jgi:glutaredoxin
MKFMIKLFTIDCPQCIVLEKKLKAKNIEFERIDDREFLTQEGLTKFPILEVDGHRMEMPEANAWVNSQNN